MCVCASMSPGSTVALPRSITRAPVGMLTSAGAPTATMRSSRSTTTRSASSCPARLSNRCAARIAMMPPGARHWIAASSMPKQGCAPAPRHGVPGPPAWACSAPAAKHASGATKEAKRLMTIAFTPFTGTDLFSVENISVPFSAFLDAVT